MLDNCFFTVENARKMFSILFSIPQLCFIFWSGFLIAIPLCPLISHPVGVASHVCNLKLNFHQWLKPILFAHSSSHQSVSRWRVATFLSHLKAGFLTSGTLRDTPNRCVAYSWRTAGNYLTYSAIYITVYIAIKQANQYISSRSGENF